MTDARVTQEALELWSQGTPLAQATQVALEAWGSVASVTVQALVTSVALEMWAVAPPAARGGPMISMVF